MRVAGLDPQPENRMSQPSSPSTTIQKRAGEVEPQLPHERDESQQGESTPTDPVVRQGKADLDHGLADTDRRPPMDRAYEQQKSGGDASGAGVRKTDATGGPGDRKSASTPKGDR
jgi:hypothetical protein